jgi:hypothetical protein
MVVGNEIVGTEESLKEFRRQSAYSDEIFRLFSA